MTRTELQRKVDDWDYDMDEFLEFFNLTWYKGHGDYKIIGPQRVVSLEPGEYFILDIKKHRVLRKYQRYLKAGDALDLLVT